MYPRYLGLVDIRFTRPSLYTVISTLQESPLLLYNMIQWVYIIRMILILKGCAVMKHLSKMMMILFFRSQSLLNSYHQLCRRLSAASLRKQPNRPGIWPHGICTYVDKTSVVSEYYNPPYYRLAANVLTYNIDKGTLYKTKTVHYSYDTSTGAISSGGGAPYTTAKL